MKLYEALNDHMYRIYALYAKNFVLSMWNVMNGSFTIGTLDDGIQKDTVSNQAANANTWALLVLGEKAKYGPSLTWIENNCKAVGVDGYNYGYDFDTDLDGIWFEGSACVALAHQMLGNNAKLINILVEVMNAQDSSTGGILSASHEGVSTSFNGTTLKHALHTGSTASFIFAADYYNPMWGQDVSSAVPYEGGYDQAGMYIFHEPWAEPSIADISPTTDGTARAEVNFSGLAGDDKGTTDASDDGTIAKYEWDFDGQGVFDWSSTQTGDVTYWYTEIGTHLARFRVTNDKGYTRTRGVTFEITADDIGSQFSAPQTTNVSADPLSGTAPLTVSFTGSGTDSDGSIVSYEWDFNGNGEYDS